MVLLHTTGPTAIHLEDGDGRYRMIYPHVRNPGSVARHHFDPSSPEVIVMTDIAGVTATTPTQPGLPAAAVQIRVRLGPRSLTLLGVHTLSPGTATRQTVRNGELDAVTTLAEDGTPARGGLR